MQQLRKLSRADWRICVLSLLLIVDLLAAPYWSVGRFVLGATSPPHGGLAALAVLAAVAVPADLLIERFSRPVDVPWFGGSRETSRLALAVLGAACLLVKFVSWIHFDVFRWGFYLAWILTAGLLYALLEARRDRPT